jgi:hypothetical protein
MVNDTIIIYNVTSEAEEFLVHFMCDEICVHSGVNCNLRQFISSAKIKIEGIKH